MSPDPECLDQGSRIVSVLELDDDHLFLAAILSNIPGGTSTYFDIQRSMISVFKFI